MFQLTLVSLFAVVVLIFILISFQYTSQKSTTIVLDKSFTLFLLVFILTVFPLSPWHPKDLALGTLAPTKLFIRLAAYVLVVIICRSWFKGAAKSFFMIFKDPFLGALVIVMPLSAVWSTNPVLSLQGGLAALGVAALAAQTATRYSWAELVRFIRWSLAIVAILSVLVAVGVPSVGRPAAWAGILGSDKALSSVMTLSSVMWFWNATCQPKYIRRSVCFTSISILLVILGTAKAALIALLTLLLAILMLRLNKSLEAKQAIVVSAVLIAIEILGGVWLHNNLDGIFAAMGKNPDLSGRTDFWPQLLQKILERPWGGYGYAGFWQDWLGAENPANGIMNLNGYVPPHSHNGLFEIPLQLGIIGLALYMLSLMRNVVMGFRYLARGARNESAVPLLILAFLITTNLAETERLGLIGPNYTWFYFVLVAVRLSLPIQPFNPR